MCAHIGQNRHIYPPSIFHLHFDSRHPPRFPQVHRGGCYRENFFYFLFFWFVIVLVWFWLSDYRLIISIFNLLILTRFDYAWLSSLTRLIFARYSLSVLRYVSSHQFRLVSVLQILRFDSSTLYLFDSSAYYKQTSMLIWVCFMLILAILRLSDVFSFVLGVVYRLGIK